MTNRNRRAITNIATQRTSKKRNGISYQYKCNRKNQCENRLKLKKTKNLWTKILVTVSHMITEGSKLTQKEYKTGTTKQEL